MSGLVQFLDADGFNRTNVSEATPLPVEIVDLEGDVNIAGDAIADFSAIEAGIGAPDDAAWDGESETPASAIAVLKAIYAQLVAINANTA